MTQPARFGDMCWLQIKARSLISRIVAGHECGMIPVDDFAIERLEGDHDYPDWVGTKTSEVILRVLIVLSLLFAVGELHIVQHGTIWVLNWVQRAHDQNYVDDSWWVIGFLRHSDTFVAGSAGAFSFITIWNVLHNTFIPRLADWHQVPGEQRMQNLQHFYRDIQHWSAGPHLFIADDLIWAFTPLNTPGVHSPSWNAISWGVELVGDYSTENLNAGVQENAAQALAALYVLGGITPDALRLHKEGPKTTHKDCPGTRIVKNDVIAQVTACLSDKFPGEHVPGAVA